VVPDLTADPRFERNPLVTAAGGLRFYAGALLETPEGLPLGTVCVLDNKPRPGGVTERQARALEALASQTMAQLEARRSQAQTRESESRLRFLDQLAEVTQPLTDADAVMAVTARLLAEHLKVSVCAYADMDEDEDGFTIRGDWAAPERRASSAAIDLPILGRSQLRTSVPACRSSSMTMHANSHPRSRDLPEHWHCRYNLHAAGQGRQADSADGCSRTACLGFGRERKSACCAR
jgi:GAF domain-containing protein